MPTPKGGERERGGKGKKKKKKDRKTQIVSAQNYGTWYPVVQRSRGGEEKTEPRKR